MLTFLRKIRLRLISQASSDTERKTLIESSSAVKPASPVGRYMVYAFGEIALVVIGILIALQINNWNEANKLLIKEIKV